MNGFERIGLAKAASWKGPYGRVSEDAIFTGRQDDQKTFVEARERASPAGFVCGVWFCS